jgi:multiple sugar transport system permease protein
MASTMSNQTRRKIGLVLLYVLLIVGSVICLLPFVWTVSTSLKTLEDAMRFPPTFIPRPVVWTNFKKAWTAYVPFNLFFLNSAIVTGLSVLGNIFTSAMVAFGFSRLQWVGRDAVFGLVLASMMLPYQVTMIPLYILFRHMGWIDTLKPLIVPNWFGNAFFIFLLRQFFMTIPNDLDDAARIDGASSWTLFWRIIMPLTKPALTTVGIFSFTWNWNDFVGPLIYLNSMEKMTVAVGLSMFQGTYTAFYTYLMAASLIALAPLLVVFIFAQRYFIEGIVLTGLKG